MLKELEKIEFKGHEIRIYKWINKSFNDFQMPRGFEWCKATLFIDAINNNKIKLEKYPIEYFFRNVFEKNIKEGYQISRLCLLGGSWPWVRLGTAWALSSSAGRVVVSRKIKRSKNKVKK